MAWNTEQKMSDAGLLIMCIGTGAVLGALAAIVGWLV